MTTSDFFFFATVVALTNPEIRVDLLSDVDFPPTCEIAGEGPCTEGAKVVEFANVFKFQNRSRHDYP